MVNIDITYEVDRATRIIENCTILVGDAYLLGKQFDLYEYSNVLAIVRISRDFLTYSIDTIVSDELVFNATYTIREFLRYEFIKSTLDYFDLWAIEKCSINNEEEIITETVMDFREYRLPITSDGVTAFTMPFAIEAVDVEYVTLTVGGDNVKFTNSSVGFHMVGNTLYWHGDYPLRTNYEAIVKYVVGTI